mmetsp:Transcript_85351/g.227580  ORF Transcript_85351/g.227580 Transcript_85351/m.227580 type:complete len:340 (+) Transcript_85351:644-1663(+)
MADQGVVRRHVGVGGLVLGRTARLPLGAALLTLKARESALVVLESAGVVAVLVQLLAQFRVHLPDLSPMLLDLVVELLLLLPQIIGVGRGGTVGALLLGLNFLELLVEAIRLLLGSIQTGSRLSLAAFEIRPSLGVIHGHTALSDVGRNLGLAGIEVLDLSHDLLLFLKVGTLPVRDLGLKLLNLRLHMRHIVERERLAEIGKALLVSLTRSRHSLKLLVQTLSFLGSSLNLATDNLETIEDALGFGFAALPESGGLFQGRLNLFQPLIARLDLRIQRIKVLSDFLLVRLRNRVRLLQSSNPLLNGSGVLLLLLRLRRSLRRSSRLLRSRGLNRTLVCH